LLQDLCAQNFTDFRVLVLAGPAHADLAETASRRTREILEPYRSRLNLHLCDATGLENLKRILGFTTTEVQLLHLEGHAGVRNIQLLVPLILGSDLIVALDDDERLEPDYMDRALTHLGKEFNGRKVLGLAGPYVQPDGGYFLPETPVTQNVFRDKARHINAAMRQLLSAKEALVPSPLALGGNMAFHRDIAAKVCFDPAITRGEDIDYLISARLQGVQWWFDPRLSVRRLPPQSDDAPAYQRMREDVFRFTYEREKLHRYGRKGAPWLKPYPGAMLGDALAKHALSALQAEATPDLVQRFGEPASIIKEAQAHAKLEARRYPGFLDVWEKLTTRIAHDAALRAKATEAVPAI
jgi:hypothetical protein